MALDHPSAILIFLLTCLCCLSLSSVVPMRNLSPNLEQHHESRRTISPEVYQSLEELSRIVDVSYCVGTSGVQKPFKCLNHCNEFQGFELIASWNTGPFLSDSCGYVALSHHPSPKRIIVAFRGTYSIANTIVDLTAYPQAYVPYKPGDVDGDNQPAQCPNCTVHAGFMTSWQNARSTVLHHVSAARKRYPDYKLVLVGHSLGGAVAGLAGMEMQLRGWEPQVTTFGEPKVGNREFAGFVDALFGLNDAGALLDDRQLRFRKVTHVHDPVPLLPQKDWGYEMHAGEIYISKVNLSPSISDIELCSGGNDTRCISGAEDTLETALYEVRSMIATGVKGHSSPGKSAGQAVLGFRAPSVSATVLQSDRIGQQSLLHLPWNLIPARYRLWELLFSHRDYFWRLGLCVPGGDPTGK